MINCKKIWNLNKSAKRSDALDWKVCKLASSATFWSVSILKQVQGTIIWRLFLLMKISPVNSQRYAHPFEGWTNFSHLFWKQILQLTSFSKEAPLSTVFFEVIVASSCGYIWDHYQNSSWLNDLSVGWMSWYYFMLLNKIFLP